MSQLEEAAEHLNEGDDMATENTMILPDPESTGPNRYIVLLDGGPVNLPLGFYKIQYSGSQSENYFREEDEKDLEN